MSHLFEYIQQHALRLPPGAVENAVSVVFFNVRASETADAGKLRALVEGQKCVPGSPDLFDGQEHNYLELGAWLGDQGAALALIGLGHQLELWQMLSPRTVLGLHISDEQEQAMAGGGMIALMAKKRTGG